MFPIERAQGRRVNADVEPPVEAAAAPAAESGPALVRAIGPWTLGANTVNLTIGAGILVLPGIVAAILGPAAIVAYLICGVAIALVLTCYIEIGTHVTRSGGTIAYIEDAFGPMAGFVGWVIYALVYCLVSDAAIALAMMDAVGSILPAMGVGWIRGVALVVLFGGLAAINISGVRAGVRVAVGLTVAKLVPLLLLIGAGLFAMNWSELRIAEWPSATRLGEACLVLFFMFGGAEAALTSSGEIRDPSRTVRRGVIGGAATVVAIFMLIQVVSQGVLGAGLATATHAPLAALASRLFGGVGGDLLAVVMSISVISTLAGDMLATPRAVMPVAQSGVLPRILARVHPRFRTPHIAIAAFAGLTCFVALTGAFEALAVLASAALLLVYLAICVAALKRRFTHARAPGDFRAPGGPLVPGLGVAVVLWLLAQTRPVEIVVPLALVALAVVYYRIRRQFEPDLP